MARREHGSGTIYRRADGTWAGQINVAPDGAARRRRTVYGKTRAEVVRKLGEARKAKERGDHSTSTMTFGAWLDRWIVRADLKPTTRRSYRSIIKTHLKPTLGNVRLDRLTTDHVDRLHDAVSGSSTTVRNVHRCASAAMSAAVAQGRVSRNVFRNVPAPPKTGSKPVALTAGAAQAVEELASRSDAELTRWQAALYLGMRPGERRGLRWSHVDLEHGHIDIEWQLQQIDFLHGCEETCGRKRGGNCPQRVLDISPNREHEILEGNFILQTPKTKTSIRRVSIPNFMIGPMRRHWIAYLEQRDQYDVDHELVWHDGRGHPIASGDDRAEWDAILAEAGVPPTMLYAGRHTAATLLLEKGADAKVIQSIMGHSDVLTTRGYQQVRLGLQRSALDRAAEPIALEP